MANSVRFLFITALFIITCKFVESFRNGSKESRDNDVLMESSKKRKKKIPDSYSNKKRFDPKTGAPRIMYDLDYTLEGTVDFQKIADSFLKNNTSLMKIGDYANDLEPFMIKNTPAGATVRYRQKYGGIEVYDSDVAISVNNKKTVTFVMSDYKPDIHLVNTFVLVSRENALNTALKEMSISNDEVSAVEAKIVVFAEKDNNKSSHISWLIKVIAMKEKLISYEFIYDASSGINLQIKNLISDKLGSKGLLKGKYRALVEKEEKEITLNPAINVQVASKTNLGPSLEDYLTGNNKNKSKYMRGGKNVDEKRNKPMILEIFVGIALYIYSLVSNHKELVDGTGSVFDPNPLATAKAKYNDPGFANYFGITTPQLAAQIKNVTLRDITFDGFYYKLEGPYASHKDFDTPYSRSISATSRTGNFFATRENDLFNSVNAYYHIDSMMRYIHLDLGIEVSPFVYKGGVQYDAYANNGQDNSYYSTWSQQLAFGEGGVDDAEDADVVIHELSHGLHDWLTGGGMSQEEGLSEGIGDYFAVSYSRSRHNWTPENPEYYWAYPWDGHNEFWEGRVTNYDKKYPDGLIGDIHLDGQIWSTCNLKIWDAIGREATDKALLVGISYTGINSNQSDMANAVIRAARDLDYPILYIAKIIEIYADCGYDVSCGNGIREGNEECDGNDIGNASCEARGCTFGKPKCRSSCKLDYSDCEPADNHVLFEIVLSFDKYPHENSWELVSNSAEQSVYLQSNYTLSQNKVREVICINSKDCYSFSIYDALEDGMCCEFGKGGYELILNGTVIVDSNFTSGDAETTQIGTCP